MLVPKLTKADLKDISAFHRIGIPGRRTTDEIKNILSEHVCNCECTESVSIFERLPDKNEILHQKRKQQQVLGTINVLKSELGSAMHLSPSIDASRQER
jgi:IS1 family transposase